MVICSLLGSLRVCLERHPPLVSFFFCLLSLAVAFLGFAVYIQSHDVQNPDVEEDWNSLLKSLANLMFCIPNKTQQNASTVPSSTTTAESFTALSVMVGLSFDLHNGTDPPNGTHLGLTVSGTELGLKGPDAQEPIHLLAVIVNSVSRESCLSIIAPSSLLPKTRQPPRCVIGEWDIHLEEPGICYKSHYQPNPALSSLLDQADRALCSQRLLMTSAFLLCLCAMLACAAGLCYPVPRDKWGQI
ncbi:insulin-like growth factor-binding protein 3 receptor isoform X2 [Elgaria multicarinata webbii]|uniref:insulin-like growth factor-binding protein 3 receptor isoform X2 n=1 Tax=Elgaria multicarinata webbii TaxID=159646 RepID=UPI002FCCE668